MADQIQTGTLEAAMASGTPGEDNNAGSANAPAVGERSAPMMARPDWVPEKFFKDGVIDYKAMALQNQELEKQFTQSRQQKAEAEATGEPKAGEQPKPEDKPAQPPVAIPGVAPERITHFTEEISKGGKLSDASYEELTKLGYPKPVVDAYVRGLNADTEVKTATEGAVLAAKQIEEITSTVGGQAELGKMLGWAKSNWSPADQKVYNDAVSSGDVSKVKMAVAGLKAAYTEEHGEQPQYIGGRKPALDSVEPYLNEEEVSRDMGKREYKESESFRQKVAKRLAVSDVFKNSRDTTKVQR